MNRLEHVEDHRRNAEHYSDPTAFKALEAVGRKSYPRVFICSPYRRDPIHNALKALQYCRFALKHHCFPIAPHIWLPRFMDDNDPAERELALSFGERLLCGCREVWVFGDRVSAGMARELKTAQRRGIFIRRFNNECQETHDHE